jgi:hypothetical protein
METTAAVVSNGTLYLVLGIAGAIILITLAIIGFFLRSFMKTIHDDVKSNTSEAGKNKGRIELVEQKQEQDKIHLEQLTQVQIQGLATEVAGLTSTVNSMTNEVRTLITELVKKAIDD